MLLACSSCHRQYDVGAYHAGSRIRCKCGTLNSVPEPHARQVAMLHCSNCGGKLDSTSAPCPYCAASVKLADRGFGPACPECFVTTFAGAHHCHACGVRIEPETVLHALSSHDCPRCLAELTEFETGAERYVSCTGCGGVWLDEALFRRVAEKNNDELVALIQGTTGQPAAPRDVTKDIRYLPCPNCGELMNRRNFAECSGIILDNCREHGWWFDAQELERVVGFLRAGGLERSRYAKHEKMMGDLRRQEDRARWAESLGRGRGLGLPHLDKADASWELVEVLATVLRRALA